MNETQSKAKPNTKRYHVMMNCVEVEEDYLRNLQELNEVFNFLTAQCILYRLLEQLIECESEAQAICLFENITMISISLVI